MVWSYDQLLIYHVILMLHLRGFMVQWRYMERNEALCFDKPERLWDG